MDFDTLIHCDCIEYMKNMPKNSVDLTLTDIPYCEVNTNIGHNGMDRRNLDKGDADTKTFELSEFLPLVDKVTKGSIVIFCGIEQLAQIFTYFKKKKYPTRHLVWAKTNPSVMNGEKEYLNSVENAVWTKKPGAYFGGFCIPSVLTYPQGTGKLHPTEKNHDLLRQLIIENSRPNQIVFDPCAGSGSTLLVAGNESRHFLGCELREKYFIPAIERLKSEGGFCPSLFDESELIEENKQIKMQSLFEEAE